jgi:metal-sulfur cluster biosynthetic enzyme
MTNNSNIITIIEDKLKTIYDPEFPIVDIYTLGLIYNIDVKEESKKINLLITFTTPFCPMADMLKEMMINGIAEVLPEYEVILEVTFEPLWTIEKIKDPDLKRMFE